MIILSDLDGVLVDSLSVLLEEVWACHGIAMQLEDVTEWDVYPSVVRCAKEQGLEHKTPRREEIDKIWQDPLTFSVQRARPFRDVWKALLFAQMDLEARIIFHTRRDHAFGRVTEKWLIHYGFGNSTRPPVVYHVPNPKTKVDSLTAVLTKYPDELLVILEDCTDEVKALGERVDRQTRLAMLQRPWNGDELLPHPQTKRWYGDQLFKELAKLHRSR